MKNYRLCLIKFVVILSFFPLAVPEFSPALGQYAINLGGSSFDGGVEVDVDAEGNAYFIGNFADTLDFDPGPESYYLDNNNGDVFVASYDTTGAMRFAFRINGSHASVESAGDIDVAPDGSFVITGAQPFGTIDFDPDPINERVRSGELYIAGYTNEGKIRFVAHVTGGQNTSSGKGHAVTLDEAGNVYATGAFMTSLDFNPADTSSGILPNAGNTDVFVASYTQTGAYRYAYSFGGNSSDYGTDIEVDRHGNLYVAGLFSGEVYFDPDDKDQDGDRELRTSEKNQDLFLASFDSLGHFRYAYTYAGTTSIRTNRKLALSIDLQDNIYFSGETYGTVYFDPEDADQNGDLVERTADPLGSAFIASYSSSGKLRFATVLKGGPSASTDVYASKDGDSFLTGTFSGDVDFDPDRPNEVLSSRRGADVFVASYDSTGAYRLAFNLASSGLSSGYGIAVDESYNIALTGGFTLDLDVAYNGVEDLRTSSGQNDIFMTRFPAAGVVSVNVEEAQHITAGLEVQSAYPNPFNTETHFSLKMQSTQNVRIEVYDILGRRVDRLFEGPLSKGIHTFSWNGGAERGGLYFIRIDDNQSIRVLRTTLIR